MSGPALSAYTLPDFNERPRMTLLLGSGFHENYEQMETLAEWQADSKDVDAVAKFNFECDVTRGILQWVGRARAYKLMAQARVCVLDTPVPGDTWLMVVGDPAVRPSHAYISVYRP